MKEKLCFVISPISEEGTSVRKHADKVLNHLIKPVCKELNYKVLRADEMYGTSVIIQDILSCLDNADLVIADVTELNPNVFIEIGYRLKTKKQFILIKDVRNDSYPFDISGYRHMLYSLDLDNIEKEKEILNKFILQDIPKPEEKLVLYDAMDNKIVFYGNGDIEKIPPDNTKPD